jgi:hypothetical protein
MDDNYEYDETYCDYDYEYEYRDYEVEEEVDISTFDYDPDMMSDRGYMDFWTNL